ncbi:aminopeptidase P family protein [Yinghuangia sp. ASG 101]|uniref:M24 family metallopeptidase n=1 Tax=Yinghuangia sp. ASG 101 TaxID=2896848 RepID=UPI001E5E9891|nr:M24 family metallopeptidase [Yinghuangia sp. ASG 101]UGQ11727.1 aminopeptidase P family protein [Yinghuangia sp. ASG 101]
MPVDPPAPDEAERAARLVAAQDKALALFDEIAARGLVAPGVGEREASDRVRDLAHEMFGVTKYWHKRIIRSGPNTLAPYRENPPDRVIGEDDIAFADFGPIFSAYEADFGRTYVFGDDPDKHRLVRDLSRVFDAGRAAFAADPDITGKRLYAEVERLAADAGWTIGTWHTGHLVGEFPHESIDGAKTASYITPDNDAPLRRTDRAGRACHWILELHLVDADRGFGGFHEQLLDLA